MKLTWSTTKPKATGFYFWRKAKDTGAHAFLVYQGGKTLRYRHPYFDRDVPVAKGTTGQWAGPIKLPEDPFNK